jgi:HlyD family secretion protein
MKNSNKTGVIAVMVFFVIALLIAIAWFTLRQPPLPEGLVQANGRIEGDHYTVSSKWPGRIIELLAREGDQVQAGQLLIRLDDAQTRAKLQQAQATVEALTAQLKSAQTSLQVFTKTVALRIDTAKAAVSHAQAAVASAEATELQTRRDARRFRALLKSRTVKKHQSEQADLAWKVAKANLETAKAALVQAEKQLAEAQLGWEQIKARKDEVNAIAFQVKQAEAVVAEVQSTLNDLLIKAPATGMITTRIADLGEVVAAGSPLYDIVDLDKLYLKVYVAENKIGKIRLNLPARIYTDSFPEQPFPATVRYIASQAEFTPKEVQTPDERVKLVYAVKLYLDENPEHRLTPGLPADAIIRWREKTPWAKPQW